MKEYVRRVKATVEESWLDDGEGVGGAEGAAAAGEAQPQVAAASSS